MFADTTHLRTTVSSGRYVVDPFAVADALLARAGISAGPVDAREDGDGEVSRGGAPSPPASPPPSPSD